MKDLKKIILASPRGFCAGVRRAVETVEQALQVLTPPLYVRHEIVHNKYVVERLVEKGVKFVDDLDEVPEGNWVIFSAHGVSPEVWAEAEKRKLKVIDATCPLVTKVHLEAIRYAEKGYQIILIGHKKHAETEGVLGEAPGQITIVSNAEDIDALLVDPVQKYACLTQTTLSKRDTALLMEQLKIKIPALEVPAANDICYATTNRQNAVSEISEEADLFLVIGSANSSNSNRLKELAGQMGKKAHLIDDASMIEKEWLEGVSCAGITAGASAPENLVEEVIARLRSEFGFGPVEERILTEEKTSFSAPEGLQKLLTNQ